MGLESIQAHWTRVWSIILAHSHRPEQFPGAKLDRPVYIERPGVRRAAGLYLPYRPILRGAVGGDIRGG